MKFVFKIIKVKSAQLKSTKLLKTYKLNLYYFNKQKCKHTQNTQHGINSYIKQTMINFHQKRKLGKLPHK